MYEGLRHRKRGTRRYCGCIVTETRNRRHQVRCPGVGPRFASEMDAYQFALQQQSEGGFCIFTKAGRRRKRRKSRRR